jgi:hypothetical protein
LEVGCTHSERRIFFASHVNISTNLTSPHLTSPHIPAKTNPTITHAIVIGGVSTQYPQNTVRDSNLSKGDKVALLEFVGVFEPWDIWGREHKERKVSDENEWREHHGRNVPAQASTQAETPTIAYMIL